jgi:RNA polymerase sporulation-specific sigma factor
VSRRSDLPKDRLSDRQLTLSAQRGCSRSTEELLRRYTPLIVKYCSYVSAPGWEYEDLLVQGKLSAWEAIMAYDFTRSETLGTLMVVFIRNRIFTEVKLANRKKHRPLNDSARLEDRSSLSCDYDLIEREVIEREVIDPCEVIVNKLSYQDLLSKVRSALSDLEFKCITALADGDSYDEISRSLNITRKSVDNAISRVKRIKSNNIKGWL